MRITWPSRSTTSPRYRDRAGSRHLEDILYPQDRPGLVPKGRGDRYGVVLGYAKAPIPVGAWINEHMLDLPQSPGLDDMPYGTSIVPMEELPDPPRRTWMGYRNKTGPAGTRNLLGIVTTVQCAAGVVNVAVERIKRELLPKYPNVDGVVAVNHPYGCGSDRKTGGHTPIRRRSPTSSATPTSAAN